MTGEHDAVQGLLAAVALGAATPEEVAHAEAHAASCQVCEEELDRLREAVDAMALAVPQVEPPPALRGRVMAAVREDLARRPAALRTARPRAGWRDRLRGLRPWPALAAVATAAALALLGWNLTLHDGGGGAEGVTAVAVEGTAAAPGVRGQLLYVASDGTAVMRLRGLPDPGPGRAWELWTIRDRRPVASGFANEPGPGEAVVAAGGLADAEALALSSERPTNRRAPTRDPVVVVPLPQEG